MTVHVLAVGRTSVPACPMPGRFRHDVTYFATPAGTLDAPQALSDREYWIRAADAERILDDGVITIVSPSRASSGGFAAPFQSSRARASNSIRSPSLWSGSWWKRISRRTRASRANATVWATRDWR